VLTGPLLALCLAAAPQRYLLTVGGVPMAELRVEVSGRTYRYASTHFLEEGPKERSRVFTLDAKGRVDGLVPEVLALARRPKVGCTEVLEEVTRAPERLCVTGFDGAVATGTVAGRRFTARYDERGQLERFEVGAARWEASTAPVKAPPLGANPFTRGFDVVGAEGAVALRPALDGARRLSSPPEGVGDEASVGRLRCLVAARRFVDSHPGATLVLGLVVEDGRAWPHAWARIGAREVDPSVRAKDEVLARRQYLALPAEDAGRVYLELLDGSRQVTLGEARSPGHPPDVEAALPASFGHSRTATPDDTTTTVVSGRGDR
jgi:hypothetical protein